MRGDVSASKDFFNEFREKTTDLTVLRATLFRAGIQTRLFKKPGYLPTLDTLVGLSLISEVPVHLMLESPKEAAKIAQLEAKFAARVAPRPRALRTSGMREVFRKALLAELQKEEGQLPKPLKRLCMDFGIGVPTAEYWYHALSIKLLAKYEKELSALREKRANAARTLVREQGLPKYLAGEFTSQKEMVDWLRAESGISKGAFYRELSLQLHASREGN